MNRHSLLRFLFGGMMVLVFVSAGFAQTNGATTDTTSEKILSQKIINMETYEPMPGDIYTVTIDYGMGLSTRSSSTSSTSTLTDYTVMLQENYVLDLPFIGSLNIKGKSFAEVKNIIVTQIRKAIPIQYISFYLSLPAHFDVFLYGNVANPGLVTVNSLSRITDAFATAGGLKEGASRRNIVLHRKGQILQVDLSKFYYNGDLNENLYLKPGDKIFVPLAENTVTIQGAVATPGDYELKEGDTLEKILQYAGGMKPTALVDTIEIYRLNEQNVYSVQTIAYSKNKDFLLRKGDTISISSSKENPEMVTVEGAVFGKQMEVSSPQSIPSAPVRVNLAYFPGMSMLTVLEKLGGPTPFAESEKTYIKRKKTGEMERVPIDALWKEKKATLDVPIEPGDFIVIPMKKLKVFVTGEVNTPGAYDYTSSYKVYDYLLSAGGLNAETADKDGIYLVDEMGLKKKTVFTDNVEPGSHIFVARNPWTETQKGFQNFFIISGWVTGIVAAVITIWDFILRIVTP